MSKTKWFVLGCGGCLTIILLLAVFAGVVGYQIRQMFIHFPESMKEMEDEQHALELDYPFDPNPGVSLEPGRIDRFLAVRDETIKAANEHLPWLLGLGAESLPMHKEGSFETFKNIMLSVSKFPKVGVERAYALREQEISLDEYTHISRALSIELVTWREMEEDTIHRQTADAYFQPLITFEDNVKAYKQSRPFHGINDSQQFTMERYIRHVRRDLDEAGLNRDAFVERADRITSASAAVFVELWTGELER